MKRLKKLFLRVKTFFYDNTIIAIAVLIFLFGALIAFTLPIFLASIQYLGMTAPNEIGDAFGGATNPVIGLIGVGVTFLAFYIQYKATEKQREDLKEQQRYNQYKYLQESIKDVKDDIKDLRYTKDQVTYTYSEAIWNFMMDNLYHGTAEQQILSPLYYQLEYILTLFEPVIAEVENSDLSKKEKFQMLMNIDGLFESSLAFIVRVYDKSVVEGKEKMFRESVKYKIIIPAKKIKQELREILDRYKEPEKDIFHRSVMRIKGAAFVRQTRMIGKKGIVMFYKDFDTFQTEHPDSNITEEKFETYLSDKDNAEKIIINEPIRLLMKLDFLEKVSFHLYLKESTYNIEVDRNEIQEFLDMDLAEFQLNKDRWRDEFVGKYVYDKRERKRFLDKFVNVKSSVKNKEGKDKEGKDKEFKEKEVTLD
ncbi:MAG: hypothetical protein MUE81_01495 [Thermoflexibacter sp.]|nr:hypothetical protein [Thermoflexibacter sp.]